MPKLPRISSKKAISEQVEENTANSLSVITIGNPDRLLSESNYREKCVERLIEIIINIDIYLGSRRIFIP